MTLNISPKTWAFAAGVVVGAGAVCFIKSGLGHKAAVAVAERGMALKDCIAGAAERVKESAEDIAAEARAQRAGA